jgi:hypothetical protein
MHRARLACLLAVAFTTSAHTQQQQQKLSAPWHEPRPHHVEKDWKRAEPKQVPAKYYCNSTQPSYPTGYPHLPSVPRNDGLAQYAGSLITWTPNDNPTECHIRQLYFWVDAVYTTAPNGAREDINIYMTRHGKTDLVHQPLAWDIVSIQYPGGTLYRVDAEQVDNPTDPKGLQGDFDFVIDVVGTPAP